MRGRAFFHMAWLFFVNQVVLGTVQVRSDGLVAVDIHACEACCGSVASADAAGITDLSLLQTEFSRLAADQEEPAAHQYKQLPARGSINISETDALDMPWSPNISDTDVRDMPYGGFALLAISSTVSSSSSPSRTSDRTQPNLQMIQLGSGLTKRLPDQTSFGEIFPPKIVIPVGFAVLCIITMIIFVMRSGAKPRQASERLISVQESSAGVAGPIAGSKVGSVASMPSAQGQAGHQMWNYASTLFGGKPWGPPPLCEALVLPKTEARFLISMAELQAARSNGDVDIVSNSKKKLMHMSVENGEIKLCSDQNREDPRASVRKAEGDNSNEQILKIYGKRNAEYALIKPDGHGYVAFHGGHPFLAIQKGSQHDDLVAFAPVGGKIHATAVKIDRDMLKIQVSQGADGVFLTAVFVGILVLLRE